MKRTMFDNKDISIAVLLFIIKLLTTFEEHSDEYKQALEMSNEVLKQAKELGYEI